MDPVTAAQSSDPGPEPLSRWVADHAERGSLILAKWLSGNDTGATGAHQVGFYIPRAIAFQIAPSLATTTAPNPDVRLRTTVTPGPPPANGNVRLVWYNQGTRNECRFTRWGPGSAVTREEAAGSLLIAAFHDPGPGQDCDAIDVWVCQGPLEEDAAQEILGPVDPRTILFGPGYALVTVATPPDPCSLTTADVPPDWLTDFPSPTEICDLAVSRLPLPGTTPDLRLLRRRDCEFHLFALAEELWWQRNAPATVPPLTEFIALAKTVTQRRRARSGLSLEKQLNAILVEEGFQDGTTFGRQCRDDSGKVADYLFPSCSATTATPGARVTMLAVKTTIKERWAQVINEFPGLEHRFLLTLQEGIGQREAGRIFDAGLGIVTPAPLVPHYPQAIRPRLVTLGDFLDIVRPTP